MKKFVYVSLIQEKNMDKYIVDMYIHLYVYIYFLTYRKMISKAKTKKDKIPARKRLQFALQMILYFKLLMTFMLRYCAIHGKNISHIN